MNRPKYFLKTTKNNILKALFVFTLGLTFTLTATYYTKKNIDSESNKELKLICADLKTKIEARLHAHAELLRCGSAFFSGSDTVYRNEWKDFYLRTKIKDNLPGIQGVGYAQIIPKKQLESHIKAIQQSGYPNYIIKPLDNRDFYTSIIYLEPFTGRNSRAFGFDMYTEKIRRKAMQQACDLDKAVLSGKVILVQETNKDIQAGTLMYVPVYITGLPITTTEERRKAIKGWVYSPYRMNDLMYGILGRWDLVQQDRIHMKVYDESINEKSILFDSQKNDTAVSKHFPTRLVIETLNFNGKSWVICFSQSSVIFLKFHARMYLVFIGGIIISILLFSLTLALLNTQYSAEQIAKALISELKEEKERFQILLNSSAEGIYGIDMHGNCTFSNSSCLSILGYETQEQVLGKNMHDLIHHSHSDGSHYDVHECNIFKAFIQGKGTHIDDEVLWRADGTSFPAEYWSYPIYINGKITGAVVSLFDISERKNAEALLKASETRFKNMFTRHNSIMLLVEPESGNIVDANIAATKFYGYTNAELCSKSINDINTLPPDQIATILRKALDEKHNYFIFTHKTATGDQRIVEVHSSPIDFEGKKILFSIIHDITERQNAVQALKDSEQRWEYALEGGGNGVWDWNLETNTVFYSNQWKEILGLVNIDISDGLEEWSNRVHPDDLQGCFDAIQLHLEGKTTSYSKIYRFNCDNSSEKWILDRGKIMVFDDNGKPLRMIGTITDISERIKMEEALKESEAKSTAILHTLPDMMFIQNQDGDFVDYFVPKNSKSNFTSISLKGKKIYDFLPSEIADQFISTFKDAMLTKQMQFFEYSLTMFDKVHYFEARTINYDSDKLLSIIRDITDRKDAERLITLQNTELQKLNLDKDRFISILAHDLRSPFNAILGFSDLLIHNISTYSNDESKELLGIIYNSAKHTFNLLNELLTWARTQSGKMPFEPHELLFTDIYLEVIDDVQMNAKAKDIEISNYFENSLTIFADNNMLHTILRNLISNAIKFTYLGGKVTITAKQNEKDITISVSDNGIGIDSNSIHKLFNMSEVYTTNGTAEEKGFGFGLLLCKEFVEQHNGKIWVESEIGKGSNFRFSIPLNTERLKA